jgi:hypothetical protein
VYKSNLYAKGFDGNEIGEELQRMGILMKEKRDPENF